MKNKNSIIIGIILGIFLGSIFSFGFFFYNNEKVIKEESNNIVCSNLSFEETAYCLNKYVKTFFYYNYSNQKIDSNEMSLDKLKKEGGTCKHYSYYYERWLRKFGYNAKHISLTPKLKHGFTLAYDNNTYCILDQKNIWCVGD
ncbi:MAG: hypothetical protein ACTSW3_07185 [Promethearchaeota archaeon]